MHRWSGGLVALPLALAMIVGACSSFGTGSVPQSNEGGVTDAAPSDASELTDASFSEAGDAAALCNVGVCGAGCVKYSFTAQCPPTGWTFTGDAPVKECRDNRIHLLAQGTQDATAELLVQTPGTLRGARIEFRLAIKQWAVLNGGRARVIAAGAQSGTGVAITAIENALRDYDIQLCRIDNNGLRQNCVDLTTISANAEHVMSFDWSETGFTAIVDCSAQAIQPTAPIGGDQDFGLIFGLNDASPIDGTIGDVTVSFR
jgi:hypothetical protein